MGLNNIPFKYHPNCTPSKIISTNNYIHGTLWSLIVPLLSIVIIVEYNFVLLPRNKHNNVLSVAFRYKKYTKEHEKFDDTKSEAVNRRRPDNTMIQRKRTKWLTMMYKTLHRQVKVEQHEPTINRR